jgi:hypothetical protein
MKNLPFLSCVLVILLLVLSPDLKYSSRLFVSVLVWSDDFVLPLSILLGWFSCSLQGARHWSVVSCLESFVCASRIGFSLSDICYCLSTWSGLHFSLPFISTACRSESSLLFLLLHAQPICSSVGEAKAVPSQILPLEHCLLRIELPRETGRCPVLYVSCAWFLPARDSPLCQGFSLSVCFACACCLFDWVCN